MLSLSTSLALIAAAGAADPAPSGGPVAALEACRSVREDAARLACFDRAATALVEARARKDIVVMDRAEVRQTRRGLFGFSLPSLGLFGGDDDEALRELKSNIAAVSSFGYGYFTLILDDKSEWQTTDRLATFSPRRGDPVTIKRGAFGYRASSRGTQVAVRRVR